MYLARLLILLSLGWTQAAAQPGSGETLRGIVWTPTEDLSLAAADIRAMRQAGVEAVRLPAMTDGRVLSAADRAGLSLFLDLPIENLSATSLRDTLAFAQSQLEAVIRLAARHPSIRGVGLARAVDTSNPDACPYFEALAERAVAAGLSTYYGTRFIESDQCSDLVEMVLLDSRDRRPARLLARWTSRHETPAGIGALGAEVRDGVQGGHLTPRTQAAQARALENGLREALRFEPRPPVIFVHRWRGPFYGLHSPDGTAREAANVVAGFYTGRQTVFAIDAGPEPPEPPGATSFMILAWSVALLLVIVLTLAPRFRELVPRYFGRHGYYREAVQRSASIEALGSAGVAVALALAAGIVIGVMLHALGTGGVLEIVLAGMADESQEAARDILQQPMLVVLIGAIVYGLWLMLNMVWLRALTGRRYRVRALQAAVLAVMSRWAMFVLAILALLAAQADTVLTSLPWLLGGWAAIEVMALIRMLYDYSRITRVPMPRAIVTGVGVPIVLIAVSLFVAAMAVGPQLNFLWHLATRS